MFRVTRVADEKGNVLIQDPPIARFLFQSSAAAWLWLVVRVYVGYEWLSSGLHKLGDPAWFGDGQAILVYWKRAVAIPEPPARPLITYDWFRAFLQLNPTLLLLSMLLLLAWKNAGYIGLDRMLLPALGTPWGQPALRPAAKPRAGEDMPAARAA